MTDSVSGVGGKQIIIIINRKNEIFCCHNRCYCESECRGNTIIIIIVVELLIRGVQLVVETLVSDLINFHYSPSEG